MKKNLSYLALILGKKFVSFVIIVVCISITALSMMSHRLSTVKDMDYIYVLEGGKLIEEGTHERLIEKAESIDKHCGAWYYN